MPRTEFVEPADDDKKSDVDVLDLTLLSFDDITQIDTGVTSGADSSDWDPINVDEDKSCNDPGSNGQSADHPGAAVCRDSQSGKSASQKS